MKQDTESLPFVFNFTVSIASVVFAIAGEKKKKDPVLPAHIFVLCSKTLNLQHASLYWTASLEGKTLFDMSTPPHSSCQASVKLFSAECDWPACPLQ